ncbi:hypothetical protein HanRHA438_Chr04g0197831 [Helianthus annuus]|nr:hypothetical protein HanRHA438_Chr04g0197831 [Helianthus annuus]
MFFQLCLEIYTLKMMFQMLKMMFQMLKMMFQMLKMIAKMHVTFFCVTEIMSVTENKVHLIM